MKVCYWGTYDRDYPRNRILMEGLRRNGVEVSELHFPLWGNSAEKLRRAKGGWLRPVLLLRWAWAYASLSVSFLFSTKPDFLFVGYSGHFDVFPAWCLSRLRRVPLVFDVFLSLYDSMVLDRSAIGRRSLKARILAWVDRNSCRLADKILLDTSAHVDFFCEQFGLPREKFWVLPIGADDNVFKPAPQRESNGHVYTVLHFGRYIPLHGLETIVRAAAALEAAGEKCRFLLVGDGEERQNIVNLVKSLEVHCVEFMDTQSPTRIAEILEEADLSLGIFGSTGKASRVVPNKVYEAMAAGRPVITGDSPAAREFLRDGEDCLLCESGSPQALATAIRRVRRDLPLSAKLAKGGRGSFEKQASPTVIGRNLFQKLTSWEREHGRVA
jgi:glycosyltransferase involved in cell wall biosynthesis